MQRIKRIGIFAFSLLTIGVMTVMPSCRYKKTISDQVVVTGIGLEMKDGLYQLSIQSVDVLKTAGSLSEQSENATAVYHAEGTSVAGALQEFLNETGRSTYILHNQLISLGVDQFQQQSLFQSLDYFVRNLEGRPLVNLIICRNDPSNVLTIRSGNDAIPADYISQLLKEGNEWGLAVNTRLLDVERASGGMFDLVLPIVSMEGDTPRLDGSALFREGYLVGELSTEETTGLLFAGNTLDKCLYTVDGITFRISHVTTTVDMELQNGKVHYHFDIRGRASIIEAEQSLSSDATYENGWTRNIEERISNDVEEGVNTSIKRYGCDPLALSRRTAKAIKTLSEEQARRQLPEADFTVKTTIRLVETGRLS